MRLVLTGGEREGRWDERETEAQKGEDALNGYELHLPGLTLPEEPQEARFVRSLRTLGVGGSDALRSVTSARSRPCARLRPPDWTGCSRLLGTPQSPALEPRPGGAAADSAPGGSELERGDLKPTSLRCCVRVRRGPRRVRFG